MSDTIFEILWRRYRDEEHKLFTDEEWSQYKALFKRGVNFPDWLKSEGMEVTVTVLSQRSPITRGTPLEEI